MDYINKRDNWESQYKDWKKKKETKKLIEEKAQSSFQEAALKKENDEVSKTRKVSMASRERISNITNKFKSPAPYQTPAPTQVPTPAQTLLQDSNENSIPPHQSQAINPHENNPSQFILESPSKGNRKFLIVLAYLIPAIILAIILFIVFQPYFTDDEFVYTLDVGEEGDTNSFNPLYLDEKTASQSLSPRVKYGEETYREIISTKPFNIVFKPPIKIPDDAQTTLELEFTGLNSDIYINDELVFPNLENYKLAKEFDDSYVFIRKNITAIADTETSTPTDYITKNYYGASVYSFVPLDIITPEIEGYQKKETILSNKFRGELNLIVYTENGLNLEFTKKNINYYRGSKNYTLIIQDGNQQVVHEEKIEREGDYNISLPDINGLHYINFLTEEGGGSDTTVSNIKLDTNKVLFSGTFLPLNPINLYVESNFEKDITFFYWHDNSQKINFRNGNDTITINLSKEYKNKDYKFLIPIGNYNINIEKGDLYIKNPFILSPSKENWFSPLLINADLMQNSQIVIVDKEAIEIDKNKLFLIHTISNPEETGNLNIKTSQGSKIKLNSAEIIIL